MATNQIDTLTFNLLRGVPTAAGMMVDSFERPAVDGRSYRRLGRRGVQSTLQTIDIVAAGEGALAEAIAARLAAMKALEGDSVTVYDAFGIQHDNVRILSSGQPIVKKILHEGASKALIRTSWAVIKEYAAS